MVKRSSTSTLSGTSGNDTLVIGSQSSVNGGGGINTAVFSSPLDWYTITPSSSGIKVKNTHTGQTVTLTNIQIIDFAGGTVIDAVGTTLTQSTGTLTLKETAGNNTIVLGSETSTVVLAGTNNKVTLGAGVDSVSLGGGNGTIQATAASLNASDHLNGGAGSNTFALTGGGTVNLAALAQFANFQTISLDATGTTLTLSNAPETVTAAGGNNVVTLGNGVNTVNLGNGNDVVHATAASLNTGDHLIGGTGSNTLALSGGGTVNLASLAQFTNFQTVSLDATGTTLTLGSAAENVKGAGGNNVITLGSGIDTIALGAGNDTVTVGAGAASGSSIDGGGGVNVAVFAGAVSSYVIASTAAGIDVTNSQNGAVEHLSNIQTIDFAGGAVYDVATGQMSGVSTTTTGTGSGTGGTTSGTSTTGTISITPGTMIGTGGDVTFTVDVSSTPTWLVDGIGGNDTAVFTYGDSSWYQITKNTDGSVDVVDIHATGHSAHLIGVQTFDFANGVQYDVASGQFTTGTTSSGSTTTTSSGSTSSGTTTTNTVITDPPPPQAQASLGQIVAVSLQNNTSQLETGHEVTFGQVFADGDLSSGSNLIATVNGQQIALQVDVKDTYADGSVKFAILTLKEPDIAANSTVNVMLARGTPVTTGPAITAQDILSHGYNEQLNLTFHNSDGTTTLKSIDVGTALAQAIANNTVQTWMQGSLATEVRINVPINAQMQATFDVRLNADGTFKTDVIVGNDAAFQLPQTFNYDVSIIDHGTVAFSQSNVSQYQYSTWHQEIASGPVSSAHVVFDLAYLEKSGAVPGYDPSLGVNSSAISGAASQLTAANTGILGSALVTQYMPETGGRPDLGPTTTWTANYLVTQDATAQSVMLATADAAGAVPWHLIDSSTGEALSIENYPNLWVDYRGGPAFAQYGTQLPAAYNTSNTGWTPDTAHVPDLSYVAYLTTGDHYYLDQLQAQASYDIAALSPGYRGGAEGLFSASGQVRAVAWGLRDVGEAAYTTAAGDPLQSYFGQILTNNLNDIYNATVGNAAENATAFYGYYATPGMTTIPVFEEDMLAITMADLALQGNQEAAQIASYMNNFVAGRFLNGANGFNPLNGPGYWWSLTDSTGKAYTSWADLYNGNFAGQPAPTSIAGHPEDSQGYVAEAFAANSSLFNATHSPDNLEALSFIVSQAFPTLETAFQSNQQWDITPTLLDGHHLLDTEMQVVTAAGSTVTAATPDALIASTGGGDTLIGGNGTAILYALGGNNKLVGGSGMNYLYGETGSDTLIAGSGSNYMKGVGNNDTFVFTNVGTGHDTVAGFVAGSDHIQINSNGAPITAASLILSATSDAAGDAVLHLGGHDITLLHIQASQLQTGWFTIL